MRRVIAVILVALSLPGCGADMLRAHRARMQHVQAKSIRAEADAIKIRCAVMVYAMEAVTPNAPEVEAILDEVVRPQTDAINVLSDNINTRAEDIDDRASTAMIEWDWENCPDDVKEIEPLSDEDNWMRAADKGRVFAKNERRKEWRALAGVITKVVIGAILSQVPASWWYGLYCAAAVLVTAFVAYIRKHLLSRRDVRAAVVMLQDAKNGKLDKNKMREKTTRGIDRAYRVMERKGMLDDGGVKDD